MSSAAELPKAAAKGDLRTVKRLLAAGTPPNTKGAHGNTALHLAAGGGFAGVCRALLDAKASVNLHAADGCTPLHRAAAAGHGEACEALFAGGAAPDVATPKHVTPLLLAAEAGHPAAVAALMRGGADPEIRNPSGATPVQLAIQVWRCESVGVCASMLLGLACHLCAWVRGGMDSPAASCLPPALAIRSPDPPRLCRTATPLPWRPLYPTASTPTPAPPTAAPCWRRRRTMAVATCWPRWSQVRRAAAKGGRQEARSGPTCCVQAPSRRPAAARCPQTLAASLPASQTPTPNTHTHTYTRRRRRRGCRQRQGRHGAAPAGPLVARLQDAQQRQDGRQHGAVRRRARLPLMSLPAPPACSQGARPLCAYARCLLPARSYPRR